jgi:hypothetical protein
LADPLPPACSSATPRGARLSFNGSFSLDEITLWRATLSRNQIVSNLFARLTGSEANLLALYHCDEENGATVADSTPLDGANHGTWVGTPRFAPTLAGSTPLHESK